MAGYKGTYSYVRNTDDEQKAKASDETSASTIQVQNEPLRGCDDQTRTESEVGTENEAQVASEIEQKMPTDTSNDTVHNKGSRIRPEESNSGEGVTAKHDYPITGEWKRTSKSKDYFNDGNDAVEPTRPKIGRDVDGWKKKQGIGSENIHETPRRTGRQNVFTVPDDTDTSSDEPDTISGMPDGLRRDDDRGPTTPSVNVQPISPAMEQIAGNNHHKRFEETDSDTDYDTASETAEHEQETTVEVERSAQLEKNRHESLDSNPQEVNDSTMAPKPESKAAKEPVVASVTSAPTMSRNNKDDDAVTGRVKHDPEEVAATIARIMEIPAATTPADTTGEVISDAGYAEPLEKRATRSSTKSAKKQQPPNLENLESTPTGEVGTKYAAEELQVTITRHRRLENVRSQATEELPVTIGGDGESVPHRMTGASSKTAEEPDDEPPKRRANRSSTRAANANANDVAIENEDNDNGDTETTVELQKSDEKDINLSEKKEYGVNAINTGETGTSNQDIAVEIPSVSKPKTKRKGSPVDTGRVETPTGRQTRSNTRKPNMERDDPEEMPHGNNDHNAGAGSMIQKQTISMEEVTQKPSTRRKRRLSEGNEQEKDAIAKKVRVDAQPEGKSRGRKLKTSVPKATRFSARINELKKKSLISTDEQGGNDVQIAPKEKAAGSKKRTTVADQPVQKAEVTRKRGLLEGEDGSVQKKRKSSSTERVSDGQPAPGKDSNTSVQRVTRSKTKAVTSPSDDHTDESTPSTTKETQSEAKREVVIPDIDHTTSPIKRALRSNTTKAEQPRGSRSESALNTEDLLQTGRKTTKTKIKLTEDPPVIDLRDTDSGPSRATRSSTKKRKDSNDPRGDSIEPPTHVSRVRPKASKENELILESPEMRGKEAMELKKKPELDSVRVRKGVQGNSAQPEINTKEAAPVDPATSIMTRTRSKMNTKPATKETGPSESAVNNSPKRNAKGEEALQTSAIDVDHTPSKGTRSSKARLESLRTVTEREKSLAGAHTSENEEIELKAKRVSKGRSKGAEEIPVAHAESEEYTGIRTRARTKVTEKPSADVAESKVPGTKRKAPSVTEIAEKPRVSNEKDANVSQRLTRAISRVTGVSPDTNLERNSPSDNRTRRSSSKKVEADVAEAKLEPDVAGTATSKPTLRTAANDSEDAGAPRKRATRSSNNEAIEPSVVAPKDAESLSTSSRVTRAKSNVAARILLDPIEHKESTPGRAKGTRVKTSDPSESNAGDAQPTRPAKRRSQVMLETPPTSVEDLTSSKRRTTRSSAKGTAELAGDRGKDVEPTSRRVTRAGFRNDEETPVTAPSRLTKAGLGQAEGSVGLRARRARSASFARTRKVLDIQ